jgi:hypothetical protein
VTNAKQENITGRLHFDCAQITSAAMLLNLNGKVGSSFSYPLSATPSPGKSPFNDEPLTNQDRKPTSARKSLNREWLASRQTGAGKTAAAPPRNRPNAPPWRPKWASASCAGGDGAGVPGFRPRRKFKMQIQA